jgi:glycosyltransferase involved in cell wall biosynthesis
MEVDKHCGEKPISVILVTYNRSEKLRLSIQDVLSQSFEKFELIICDDCSPDNTREICEKFVSQDNRVRYIRQPTNLGMPGNLHEGIGVAKFEYLAILHDADRYETNLLQTWHDIFINNSNVALLFFHHAVIDKDEKIMKIHQSPYQTGLVSGKELLRKRFFRSWSFSSPVFGISMTRKSLVDELSLFKHEYNFYSDVDAWMTLLHEWDAYYIDIPLIKSYYHQTHQFDDNGWRVGSMMQKMFLKHRYLEFTNESLFTRLYETFLHYFYCYRSNLYRLMLLFKHKDYKNLNVAKDFIVHDTILLFPVWILIAFLMYFAQGRRASLS